MRKILALVLVLLTPTSALAVYEWYSISKSTRALGMGGAFYGLSDDESALFYNPAGLSTYTGGIDFMGSFRVEGATSAASALSTILDARGRSVGQLASDLQQFQASQFSSKWARHALLLARGLAVGLLLADVKANATVTGSGVDTSVDVTAIADSGLFIGFAGTLFTPQLHLGMNIKGMVRGGGRRSYSVIDLAAGDSLDLDVDQIGGAGFGVDVDLGAMYELPEVIEGVRSYASVSINNLLASKFDLAADYSRSHDGSAITSHAVIVWSGGISGVLAIRPPHRGIGFCGVQSGRPIRSKLRRASRQFLEAR